MSKRKFFSSILLWRQMYFVCYNGKHVIKSQNPFRNDQLVQHQRRNLCSNVLINNNNDENKSKTILYENERTYQNVTVDQFKELYKSDMNIKNMIKEILDIYEMEKYTTQEMPTNLTKKDMQELLSTFDDGKELRRMLKFFYTRECDKFNSRRKKFYRKQELKEKRLEKYGDGNDWHQGIFDSNGQLIYGLWHNSLLSRITKQSVRDYRQNHLLRQAAMFGQKLIIDLDYDQYMKPSEINLLSNQIGILYYENRVNRDFPHLLPYDVHFTNCNNGLQTIKSLSRHLKRMDTLQDYFHQESYLDLPNLFPKNRLVYLSPHARDSLKRYDHDDIYIIGAYNDRSSHRKVSHVKAQSEGIRCFRLPLDEHVLWKQGNKNLCLNQVAQILHAVKASNDWTLAIRKFAPQRKVRSAEEMKLEDQIRVRQVERRMKNIQKSYRYDNKHYK